MLNPLNFDFIGCGVAWKLDINLRQIRKICHRIKTISIHNKYGKFLSQLILGSSDQLSHDHRVIRDFRLNLDDIFVNSVISRCSVEFEAEVVG